jgi:hypothetical protein
LVNFSRLGNKKLAKLWNAISMFFSSLVKKLHLPFCGGYEISRPGAKLVRKRHLLPVH